MASLALPAATSYSTPTCTHDKRAGCSIHCVAIAWLLRGDVAHWIGMLCVVMYMVHMDMEMDMHSTST